MSDRVSPFPLAGVRVIEFGRYIAGPVAAVLLAEMGAEVIKVESPEGGDPFRGWEGDDLPPTFVAFNRGKYSVTVDLKEDGSRQRLMSMIKSADVLVENFRPGVMARLGLSYDMVHEHNPDLVYCSINGFGGSGPYAAMPAYDGVGLGYSGLASLTMDPGDPQLRGPAFADVITGQAAALSVLAALNSRLRGGTGTFLEVSMLGSLVHFLQSAVSKRVMQGVDEEADTRSRFSQAYSFVAGDGKALIVHMSYPEKFWSGFCRAVERPDLMEDARFADRPSRVRNYHTLRDELRDVFATRPRAVWIERLQSQQVPCAPVNTIGEALADQQLRHLGIVEEVNEEGIGTMPVLHPPAQFDGRVLPAVRRAPLLGEHDGWFFDNSEE